MNNRNTAINRRTFLLATGATMTAAALAACSGPAGGSSAGGGKTLTSAAWEDPITDLVEQQITKDFEAASGLTVQQQANVPFSDYQTRFRTLLAGGSPPDVMEINNDFLREMSDKKTVLDLTKYIESSKINKDDYFKSAYDFSLMPDPSGSGTVQSGQVIAINTRQIFYNKTMFLEAGVPLPPTTWTDEGWKWDDFLAAAKATTKGPDQWGAIVNTDTAFENTFSVNNGGPGTFSEDGLKFSLADQEGIEAVQWVADLALKHKVSPPWGELQADQTDLRLFASGKLAMLFGASGNSVYFQENAKGFEWDIAPVPGKVRQQEEGGTIIWVIPAKGKNPDAAWKYLEYIAGPEGGKVLAQNGSCVPINREAAKALTHTGDYPKNIQLFVEAADHSSSINSTKATAAAVAIYRPQLERVYSGELTAKDALSSVRDQVEAVLAG
jgi:multiple sugar transport system substrate-binding protein